MTSNELKKVLFPLIDNYSMYYGNSSVMLYADMIKSYLLENPHDVTWKIRLALVYYIPPVQDFRFIAEVLGSILAHDSNNPTALFMYAVMEIYFYGAVCERVVQKIDHIDSNDPDILYMKMMVKAFYYEGVDGNLQEHFLCEALQLKSLSIKPYDSLIFLNDKTDALSCMACAYKILAIIDSHPEKINKTTIEPQLISAQAFLDDWYYGYYISESRIAQMNNYAYGILRFSQKKVSHRYFEQYGARQYCALQDLALAERHN